MKWIKIVLLAATILFAGLGMFKALSFDKANPIMLTSFATFLLLQSFEYKNTKGKMDSVLTIIAAIFVYAVVIYTVFFG